MPSNKLPKCPTCGRRYVRSHKEIAPAQGGFTESTPGQTIAINYWCERGHHWRVPVEPPKESGGPINWA